MAKSNETPDFSDFSLPDQTPTYADLTEAEPAPAEAEMPGEIFAATDETEEEPAPPEAAVESHLADEDLSGVPEEDVETEAEEEPEPEPKKANLVLILVEYLGIVAICGAIYWYTTSYLTSGIWHAAYIIPMGLIPYILYKTRRFWTTPEVSAPYTAIIGLSLAALLTGVYWLGLEIAVYNKDIKAKQGKEIQRQIDNETRASEQRAEEKIAAMKKAAEEKAAEKKAADKAAKPAADDAPPAKAAPSK